MFEISFLLGGPSNNDVTRVGDTKTVTLCDVGGWGRKLLSMDFRLIEVIFSEQTFICGYFGVTLSDVRRARLILGVTSFLDQFCL